MKSAPQAHFDTIRSVTQAHLDNLNNMAAFVLDNNNAQHVAWAVDSYQLSLIGAPIPSFNAEDNASRLRATGLVGRALANVTNVKPLASFAPYLSNPSHRTWTLTRYTLGVFAPRCPILMQAIVE